MTDPRLSGAARHADDTRRRFLVDVVALVPLARLIEIHLFTPIRQGGTETGLAIVVARRAAIDVEPVPNDDAGEGPSRHTIFAARYRLVRRGPDLGGWSVDVVEEADAPLITVEAVVRGVQRRAGDAAAADRLDVDTVVRTIGGGV